MVKIAGFDARKTNNNMGQGIKNRWTEMVMASVKDAENFSVHLSFQELLDLYLKPIPASRSGALYSAFSYPTKISPESIAVFIASHTKPGDTVLDPFGGSGTTGLAVHLCAKPTKEVLALAKKLGAPVTWGPRNAVIYELSVLGSFVARTMCDPPEPYKFLQAAEELISTCEDRIGSVYRAADDCGCPGKIRYAIWSDILDCSYCGYQVPFWDAMVTFSPLAIASTFKCPACKKTADPGEVKRVLETFYDPITGQQEVRRKRVLKRIYGQTGNRKWSRPATEADEAIAQVTANIHVPRTVPVAEIQWGDLFRAGYHKGITHAHHFYTPRNLLVMATLWEQIAGAPAALQDALKLLALSYNATHSTLMTRVVVKSGEKDFVVTGAQPGVLYISSLPVEKNILEGLRRKMKTIAKAFAEIRNSRSQVRIVQGSSTHLDLPNKSVDYVFTDPPFGDYIPYAEINFLNEVWLGKTTNRQEEIIVSSSQGKSVHTYGKLIAKVFKEIARTLKDNGKATVVFHSSKRDIWQAFQKAYQSAGLNVIYSSVLDKLQGSFKQVTSTAIVKGDPLLLLTKSKYAVFHREAEYETDEVIARLIIRAAQSVDDKERTPERLYSRFVAWYLEHGLSVPMDAVTFYKKIELHLEAL